jgi:nitrate/nitrite-specific signal transduction histidine kinase
MKKTFLLSLFLIVMMIPQSIMFAEEISSLSHAVNVAGKQRMYTMRILRDYIMVGAKLTYKDPASDLSRTVADFGKAHDALDAYLNDQQLKSEMDGITKQWKAITKMVSEPPVQSNALEYARQAIKFREMLNDFTNHLSKTSSSHAAEAVNLSGRLRAVSQALASVYMLRSWGATGTEKKMKVPMERFRGSLDYLHAAQETTEPMKQILSKLEKIYLFFEVMNQSDTMTPTLVIKKTDAMLKLADALTKMYVKAQ